MEMMMNKRAAKKAADEFEGTIRDLRTMVEASSRDGVSTLSPGLTKGQVVDIFAAALADRDDDERPRMWRPDPYSRTGKMMATKDRLLVQNIYRECA